MPSQFFLLGQTEDFLHNTHKVLLYTLNRCTLPLHFPHLRHKPDPHHLNSQWKQKSPLLLCYLHSYYDDHDNELESKLGLDLEDSNLNMFENGCCLGVPPRFKTTNTSLSWLRISCSIVSILASIAVCHLSDTTWWR